MQLKRKPELSVSFGRLMACLYDNITPTITGGHFFCIIMLRIAPPLARCGVAGILSGLPVRCCAVYTSPGEPHQQVMATMFDIHVM